MATIETKVYEDAEQTIYGQVSEETYPDGRPHWTGTRVEWKPGSVAGNSDLIRARAGQALAANAVFLANGAPTNAQVVAQVRMLTKECNALIRLLLGQLDDTAGT